MTLHKIQAPIVIHDADGDELARTTLALTVEFTAGYRADDDDPGCGDTVELHAVHLASMLPGWLLRNAGQAWLTAHHDEVCARCRADGEPDADRLREDAEERERV